MTSNESNPDALADAVPTCDVVTKTNDKAAKKTPSTKSALALEILRDIRSTHQTNGLRHGDHQRYRRYCSRRLHRLRRSVRFGCGKKTFNWRELTPEAVWSERHFLIALASAERAWAASMDIKNEYLRVKDENPRPKFHYLSRMRRAVKWAAQLEMLCEARADEKTQLEAKAYHAWMRGNLGFEAEDWEPALTSYQLSVSILKQLQRIGDTDYQSVCQTRLDATDPAIRFCLYRLGREADVVVPLHAAPELEGMLDTFLEERARAQAKDLRDISWNGRVVPIKSPKLRVQLVAAMSASYDLERGQTVQERFVAFDRVLAALSEASALLRADPIARGGASVSTKDALNHATLTSYVATHQVNRTLERIEALLEVGNRRILGAEDEETQCDAVTEVLGATTQPSDLVRLHDTALVSLARLESMRDASDVALGKQLLSRQQWWEASRVHYIGLAFAHTKQWAHAHSVTTHALELAREALGAAQQCPSNPSLLNHADELQKRITASLSMAQARALAENGDGGEPSYSTCETAVLRRLSRPLDPRDAISAAAASVGKQQGAVLRVAEAEPSLVPVACKPVLFDLALESHTFPSLEARKKKKGFFSSLWG